MPKIRAALLLPGACDDHDHDDDDDEFNNCDHANEYDDPECVDDEYDDPDCVDDGDDDDVYDDDNDDDDEVWMFVCTIVFPKRRNNVCEHLQRQNASLH